MVFFLNYLYSVFSAYLIGRYYSRARVSSGAFLGLLLPILLMWLFVCGGQYDVGTDYGTYHRLFSGDEPTKFRDSGEYLFAWIIAGCNALGLYGQALFYVFYAINFYFFYLVMKRIELKYIFLYVMLYITVTSLFNNQLNGLRQSTAIYMGTYALLLLIERRRWQAFVVIVAASLVHLWAAILLGTFLVAKPVRRLPLPLLLAMLGVSIGLSFVLRVEMFGFVSPYLSDVYAHYITGQEYEEKSLLLKITKLMFFPLYLLALARFRKMELTEREAVLFKWGFVSFCLRLAVLNLDILYRVFDYFLLMSVFPLYYYLRYLIRTGRRFVFLAILLLLTLFYALKTMVFASAEYLYDSIYFH